MRVVRVIVDGPAGSGKSALVEEIAIALRAIGVAVEFANGEAVTAERRLSPDHIEALELYRADVRVIVEERLSTERDVEARVGGAYRMPDGRDFWIDAPVAREIAKRVVEGGA